MDCIYFALPPYSDCDWPNRLAPSPTAIGCITLKEYTWISLIFFHSKQFASLHFKFSLALCGLFLIAVVSHFAITFV